MNLAGSEKLRSVSVAEYLTSEAVARRKHEYNDGQIYAMVGGCRDCTSDNQHATSTRSSLRRSEIHR